MRGRKEPGKPAAGGDRTRANVPEFRNILRRSDQGVSASFQAAHEIPNQGMQGISPVNQPEQDSGIKKNKHQSRSA